jgi:putative tricarboxylic transport membrane protein
MTDGGVELIVHTPAKSGPDVMAQALIAALQESEADSRTWEIVYRSGGNGEKAMRALLDGAGRDDLLSTCTPSFLQTPILKSLPFSFRDLTPVARLVSDRYLVVVDRSSPLTNADGFVRDLRTRATRTGGYMRGSINQLVGMSLAEQLGQPVDFVVTQSAADLVPALKDGRLDWAIGTPVEVSAEVASGDVPPLAVLAPTPLPRFPDVPPLASAGVDLDIALWRGLMGPPELSALNLQQWDSLLAKAVSTQAWQRYLSEAAQTGALLDGAGFRTLLERENAWYQSQLTRAGLVPIS